MNPSTTRRAREVVATSVSTDPFDRNGGTLNQAAEASATFDGLSQFITLPLPPSVNTYWRKSPHGMYITQQGKDFRKQVAEIVAERTVMKFGTARLFMAVRLCMRDRRGADLDNRLKALCDALEHAGVFDDDEQIDELLILRGPIVKGGECYVMISERVAEIGAQGMLV